MSAASLLPASAAGAPPTTGELIGLLLVPTLVLLVGGFLFVRGRSRRAAVLEHARRGGFGGPPGTTDVGTAAGFGVEQARAELQSASRTVLIGLGLMLAGALGTIVVVFLRLAS